MGSFGSFSKSQESSAEQKQHPEVLLLRRRFLNHLLHFQQRGDFSREFPSTCYCRHCLKNVQHVLGLIYPLPQAELCCCNSFSPQPGLLREEGDEVTFPTVLMPKPSSPWCLLPRPHESRGCMWVSKLSFCFHPAAGSKQKPVKKTKNILQVKT